MSVAAAAFASGSGTNLQALLDAEDEGAHYRIALVITDRGLRCGRPGGVPGRPGVRRIRFQGPCTAEENGRSIVVTGPDRRPVWAWRC